MSIEEWVGLAVLFSVMLFGIVSWFYFKLQAKIHRQVDERMEENWMDEQLEKDKADERAERIKNMEDLKARRRKAEDLLQKLRQTYPEGCSIPMQTQNYTVVRWYIDHCSLEPCVSVISPMFHNGKLTRDYFPASALGYTIK